MKKDVLVWLVVLAIMMCTLSTSIFVLNKGIATVSGNFYSAFNQKVTALQTDQEVKFNGTAIEYFSSTGSSGWNVQVDEVSSGPSEIMGHTVTVALWSAAGVPSGTINPDIEPGDKVAVYGLYMDDDYVTLSGSEGYYIKPVLKAGNVLFTTVSISNVSLGPGDTTTVPIMIYNVTNLSIAGVLMTYDPSVVQVTEMAEGDDFDLGQCMSFLGVASGVVSNFLGLSGDITFANVTFKAVGNCGDTSPLNFSYANLTNTGLEEIPRIVENGTFTIISGNQPPTNPSLTPDKPEPQTAGTDIAWTASATDPDGDTLYYQFWIRGPSTENSLTVMQSWSTDNTWSWHTTSSDIGDTDISVRIRDGHHEPSSSYDLERVYPDYTIPSEGNQLGLTGFDGLWLNIDENTGGITKIEIKKIDHIHLSIHPWGKCHPTDCDWGARTFEVDINPFTITWTTSFCTRDMTFTLQENDVLHVHGFTHFTDNSGRSDYHGDGYFYRAGVDVNEPNNVIGAATEITFNQIISGYICPAYDVDYYKFHVNSSGILTVKLESVPIDMRTRIDLYGKNFNWINRMDATKAGDTVILEREIAQLGWYYIAIRDLGSTAHNEEYTFRVLLA